MLEAFLNYYLKLGPGAKFSFQYNASDVDLTLKIVKHIRVYLNVIIYESDLHLNLSKMGQIINNKLSLTKISHLFNIWRKAVERRFRNYWTPLRRFSCNFQVVFFIGMTLMLQITLFSYDKHAAASHANVFSDASGSVMYYGKTKTFLLYADYVKLTVYKLAVEPVVKTVQVCDAASFKTHDSTKIDLRHIETYQTLGDTNIHALSAIVDDRLLDKKFIRVLGVGLMPGPGDGDVYCNYDCPSPPVRRCSVKANYVMLASGNHTDYPSYGEYHISTLKPNGN